MIIVLLHVATIIANAIAIIVSAASVAAVVVAVAVVATAVVAAAAVAAAAVATAVFAAAVVAAAVVAAASALVVVKVVDKNVFFIKACKKLSFSVPHQPKRSSLR